MPLLVLCACVCVHVCVCAHCVVTVPPAASLPDMVVDVVKSLLETVSGYISSPNTREEGSQQDSNGGSETTQASHDR